MYLLDTNIFLEILLGQEQAESVKRLFTEIPPSSLHVSDFSLHSIGILLFRRNLHEVYERFIEDVVINSGIGVLRLSAEDVRAMAAFAQRFRLDFDDAYQYTVAEKYGLTIVSFDGDFDRTEKGRIPPDKIKV
ncbi:MAG: PIN domain-containing protein [Bacillota bacterium]